MIIYKTTDRISIQIGEVGFKISPLSFKQKTDIASETKLESGSMIVDGLNAGFKAVKYSVKAVEGVTNSDGTPFELQFEDSGVLTDESAEDLLQIGCNQQLIQFATALLSGVPDKIEGVEIHRPNEGVREKKR